YFISTGLDTTTAYDTYENFYRINIIRLQNRDSKMPGWEWLNCLDDALVYTDAPSKAHPAVPGWSICSMKVHAPAISVGREEIWGGWGSFVGGVSAQAYGRNDMVGAP